MIMIEYMFGYVEYVDITISKTYCRLILYFNI